MVISRINMEKMNLEEQTNILSVKKDNLLMCTVHQNKNESVLKCEIEQILNFPKIKKNC